MTLYNQRFGFEIMWNGFTFFSFKKMKMVTRLKIHS